MFNKITIIGRLGRDAELTQSNNGNPWSKFSVAVDDPMDKQAETMWFGCNLWGKRAESLTQYLTKGMLVQITGPVKLNTHNDRTYLNVNVDSVTLLSPKNSEAQSAQQQAYAPRDTEVKETRQSFGGQPATSTSSPQGYVPPSAAVNLDDVPF